MTDPLTPEQRETLREKRRMMEFQLARISDLGPQADNWALDVLIGIRDIFVIIDSLPAPKQYTEAELREGFASQYQDGLHVGGNGEFADREIEADFTEWVECARFLGAIKDTHAEPIA